MNIKLYKFLFLSISLALLYILIYNLLHYSPILGYDAEAHFAYVDYLARYLPNKFLLPTANDTREFFNPPIAYIFPAVIQVICRNFLNANNLLNECRPYYGKATQIFQSLIFIATIYIYLLTIKRFKKSNRIFNLSFLILISILSINYRTISMIRGEIYIIFFMSLFMYYISRLEINNFNFSYKNIIQLGLVIAGLALSRQWGFFLMFPVLFLLISSKSQNLKKYLKIWVPSSILGILLSAWFYVGLYLKYGTFAAFNIPRGSFSLISQNKNFYFPSSEQLNYLFFKPIRPHLENQFLTILYSDLWGDYWGYFVFTSRFLEIGKNQLLIGNYLAKVNLLSLIPSVAILIFCVIAIKKYKQSYFVNYVKYSIITSFFGFLFFCILYPTSSGDTIKAVYMIQMFHLLVFLASLALEDLNDEFPKLYLSFILVFLIVLIHNFQSYLSHFPLNFYPGS